MLATGANGFIPKSDPPQTLVNALRLVATGGVYVSARLLGTAGDGAAPPPADASALTPRQRDVLVCCCSAIPTSRSRACSD